MRELERVMLPWQLRQTLMALEESNSVSARYGLTLSREQMEQVAHSRFDALRAAGRVEFGGGILEKLVYAFCDAPELQQDCYAETLCDLQELFYWFKRECADTVSDDELIQAMRLIYSERAHGSLEYLASVDRSTLYRIAKTGRLEGTELAQRGEEDF